MAMVAGTMVEVVDGMVDADRFRPLLTGPSGVL